MQISNLGLDIIKQYEGLRLTAYLCPANVWTIGYGHTHQVKEGDQITENMATEYLKKDVRHAQNAVAKYVKIEIEQHHFDALVSFIFNVGTGSFKNSTLLRMLNDGNFDGAEKQFIRWNKATVRGVKKVLRGLTDRRQEEAGLFGNHQYDDMPQIVDAPARKTNMNSKTNWAAGAGGVGVIASQTESIGKVIDKVIEVTNKGGDLADKIGGVASSIPLPVIVAVVVIGLFIFIHMERRKKVVEHGN